MGTAISEKGHKSISFAWRDDPSLALVAGFCFAFGGIDDEPPPGQRSNQTDIVLKCYQLFKGWLKQLLLA